MRNLGWNLVKIDLKTNECTIFLKLVAIAVEGVSCLVFHFFFDAGIAILPY